MKKSVVLLVITLLLLCIFCSCRATRCSSASLQDLQFQKEMTHIKIERIDTIIDFRPPRSLSQNIFDINVDTAQSDKPLFSSERSVLETDYAKSTAQIVDGKLKHTLENKEKIPMKVQQNNRTEASKDSIDNKKTVFIEKVVTKSRFGEDFFYYAGILASIIFCMCLFVPNLITKVK